MKNRKDNPQFVDEMPEVKRVKLAISKDPIAGRVLDKLVKGGAFVEVVLDLVAVAALTDCDAGWRKRADWRPMMRRNASNCRGFAKQLELLADKIEVFGLTAHFDAFVVPALAFGMPIPRDVPVKRKQIDPTVRSYLCSAPIFAQMRKTAFVLRKNAERFGWLARSSRREIETKPKWSVCRYLDMVTGSPNYDAAAKLLIIARNVCGNYTDIDPGALAKLYTRNKKAWIAEVDHRSVERHLKSLK